MDQLKTFEKDLVTTDEDFAKKIREECHTGDPEDDHFNADYILIDILKLAGFEQTVKEWKYVAKYYS